MEKILEEYLYEKIILINYEKKYKNILKMVNYLL